ncbi:MAG: L,D-transpeptidase family protein, partial [Ktedonobacterales bacterium]|nr:L,D-transpeptidase family protein [Ktedonobacterales bacterium]
MTKQMRSARRSHFFRQASLLLSVTMLGVCLSIAGCGGTSRATIGISATSSPAPIATVPYVGPTIVPAQSTPTPTNTPTKAKPTPGAVPTKPPVPPTAVPTATSIPGPRPDGGVPNINGQLILVSLSQQWMWVYQDRHLLFTTAITSGRPELPTPTGIYHVQQIYANITFISGWPPSSPYYYSPEHVNHALYFLYDGYYLHDA